MFADTHVHTVLKYTQNDLSDVWKPISGRFISIPNLLVGIPAYSQSDFARLAEAGFQVIICPLHPVEQKISYHNYKTSRLRYDVDKLGAQVLSIPMDRLKLYRQKEYDHYEYLKREYTLLTDNSGREVKLEIGGVKKTVCYHLVKNFGEVQRIIDLNKTKPNQHTIAVIPAIEGVHALGIGHLHFDNGTYSKNVSESTLIRRLDVVKGLSNEEGTGWIFPPLLMNMTHCFENGISGHAQGLVGMLRNELFKYDEPFEDVDSGPNFSRGLFMPLTTLGRKVIERMLNLDTVSLARPDKGRRIIPDIKHMSAQSRLDYYQIIDQYNTGKAPEKRIPVVMSHAAANGKKKVNSQDTDQDDEYLKSATFNPWSINLYDDEIIRIHETCGLIGLIMDERILAGGKKVELLKAKLGGTHGLKNPFLKYSDFEACVKLLTDQVEYIVRTVFNSNTTVPKEKIWDCICIGSDFDGQINTLDKITKATDFPRLKKNLKEQLNEKRFNDLRQGLAVNVIADKICFTNVFEFLKRNL